MTVYFNVVNEAGEKNFEFPTLKKFWAYFEKYKPLFKSLPTRFDDDEGNIIYLYDHTKAVRDIKVKNKTMAFVFRYIDLKGGVKVSHFETLDKFKDYFESLDLQEKPKVERDGDQVTYTYREDLMYKDFVAQKTASYATYLPPSCDEVRFVWIDRAGNETTKSFDDLAEFWEFFDGIECKFEPEEFFDEDSDVMNYIYDVIHLEKKGSKKRKHQYYYNNSVANFGENRDQRSIH